MKIFEKKNEKKSFGFGKKSFGFGKKNFDSDTDTDTFGRYFRPIPNFGRTLVEVAKASEAAEADEVNEAAEVSKASKSLLRT